MPIREEIGVKGSKTVATSTMFRRLRMQVLTLIFGVMILTSGASVWAQETAKSQTAAGASTSDIPGVGLYNQLQKKSLFFPDIAASNERLTTGGKFKLFVDNSISLHTISWAVLGSALSQADNSPTGFGQGWNAYASRFGSSMARQASSNFFGDFMLASALHQDPRFYPEVRPSFGEAVKYSVQRIFVTRHDDGHDVANVSGLLGPLMAEGLANVYWPERNRTVGDTFFRYGLDIATKAGGNMMREYWPVLFGKMHHSSGSTSGRN